MCWGVDAGGGCGISKTGLAVGTAAGHIREVGPRGFGTEMRANQAVSASGRGYSSGMEPVASIGVDMGIGATAGVSMLIPSGELYVSGEFYMKLGVHARCYLWDR